MRPALRTFLLVLSVTALTACGTAVEPQGGPGLAPAPDVGLRDGGDDTASGVGTDPDPGPAAGACLVGSTDCVDTPGLGDDDPTDSTPPDIEVMDEAPHEYELIEARDAADDKTAAFLQWATVDGSTLTVGYFAGVEPCFVTSEVIVSELEDVVAVTVLGGPDRTQPDAMCIEIAMAMAVEVELTEPLGDRRLVDGSRATPDDLGA